MYLAHYWVRVSWKRTPVSHVENVTVDTEDHDENNATCRARRRMSIFFGYHICHYLA